MLSKVSYINKAVRHAVVRQCWLAYVLYMQNLFKIYHVVQELCTFLLPGNGRTDRQTNSHTPACRTMNVLVLNRASCTVLFRTHVVQHMRTHVINFHTSMFANWELYVFLLSDCAPLVADLFLFCYERDFMLSLTDNNQADVVEA